MSKGSHRHDNGRYQAGARLYKVVILGQGGVGKSGMHKAYRSAQTIASVCSCHLMHDVNLHMTNALIIT